MVYYSMFRVKRIYLPPLPDDGERILVDRLWPRGLSKSRAALDGWMKEIAPSTELRRWFAHDPAKWPAFQVRYRAELAQHPELVHALQEKGRHGTVTLLYAARDTEHNEAVVLREYLESSRDTDVL
ncbi:MAG: hypothetical protein BWY76_00829 [bacterium ADurb.Bin429]|nr:MAG: hypothetical protein BWY76_00829 [bacterium ADurb.Bin429]